MTIESELILNQINFKFFVKMITIGDFTNSNNQTQNQTRSSIRNKKKVKTRIKGSFWNQESDNIGKHLYVKGYDCGDN